MRNAGTSSAIKTGLVTLLVGLLAGGALCAFAVDSSRFAATSAFATDTVDISVEDSLDTLSEPALIIGDGEVPHTLKIINEGAPCLVRCKTIYSQPDGAITMSDYAGAAAWAKGADGYAYLTAILGEGESVTVEEAVANPDAWKDGPGFLMGTMFVAEAVQARNFSPDFENAHPWGDLIAEACIYSRANAATA